MLEFHWLRQLPSWLEYVGLNFAVVNFVDFSYSSVD